MRQVVGLWLGVALLVCAGCATHTVWTGQPSVQTIVRVGYKITLEPGYDNAGGFFNHFNISVANTGPDTLEIDWRRSQYLHNGTAWHSYLAGTVYRKRCYF